MDDDTIPLSSAAIEDVIVMLTADHVLLRGRRGAGRSSVLHHLEHRLWGRGVPLLRVSAGGILRMATDGPGPTGPDDGAVAVVDDIDRMGTMAATVLANALETRGVRLLATIPEGRPLHGALHTIGGRQPVIVPVPDLPVTAADAAIAKAFDGHPDAMVRREIMRLSDCRAGVLAEILMDVEEDPTLLPVPGQPTMTLGPRVRRRVDHALDELDVAARRMLERVAIAVALPVSVLVPEEVDVVDAVARLGMLDADEAGRMRISDPVIRRLLLADMPTVTRHLHGQWLAARARTAPSGVIPSWVSVPWRLLGGEVVPEDEIVQAALGSPDPAIAEQLASTTGSDTRPREAELVLARVALVLGRGAEAEILLEGDDHPMVDPAVATGTPPLLAARAYSLTRQGDIEHATRLMAQAESADAVDDDQELARLVQLIVMGDLAEGMHHGLGLVDGSHGRRASMIMAWGAILQGRPSAVGSLMQRDWSRADNPLEATGAMALRCHSLLLDDLDLLARHLSRWRADTAQARAARWWLSGELEAARGNHPSALALLRAAEAEALEIDFFGMLPVVQWAAVRVAAQMGLPAAQTGLLQPPADDVPWGAPSATPKAVASVWTAAAAGGRGQALEVATALVATTGEAVMPAVLVLHAALRVGADPRALLALLPDIERSVDSRVLLTMCAHLEATAAGDRCRLLQVGRTFAELGHVVLAAEARAQAGIASLRDGLPATPLLTAGGPALTMRERELVALAGGGSSNAEIARLLTLSVRTVETHLSSAYRKLGIHSRAELTHG